MKPHTTPAPAYWRQRSFLKQRHERITQLYEAVAWPGDLLPWQWAQLMALARDYEPDLILELGRGKGNSTCAFTECVNDMPGSRVVSICLSHDWETETSTNLADSVSQKWLSRLEIIRADIRDVDYSTLLEGQNRILIFWDAHGFDVAECVLGRILPLVADREHIVVMHDLSDIRYSNDSSLDYQGQRLWRRNDWEGPRVVLGHIDSKVEQAVAILDFVSRNQLPLHSADHDFHTELTDEQIAELRQALPSDLYSLRGHWFWFSLSEATRPPTFPAYAPSSAEPPNTAPLAQRLRAAAKIVLKREPVPRPRQIH